jgi:two-component system chemotaxis sensor kinase CheA
MNEEKLRLKLIGVFRGELEDQLRVLEAGLVALDSDAPDIDRSEILNELFRAMHSIKGAAATVQADAIKSLAHGAENELAKAKEDHSLATATFVDGLLQKVDQLRSLGSELGMEAGLAPATRQKAETKIGEQASSTVKAPPEHSERSPVSRNTAHADEYVSIAASRLERMLVEAAEMSAALRKLEQSDWQFKKLLNAIEKTGLDNFSRHDWQELIECHTAIESDLRKLQNVSETINSDLLNAQMQRFSDVVDWLPRTLHDLAHESGKKINLKLVGGDVEISRAVAQILRNPLRHLMRNAVDHGIEPASERRKAGKPAEGTISINVRSANGRLLLEFRDDGRGLNLERIKEAAVVAGLNLATRRESVTDLVFEAGLSTSAEISQVSGRGVGLDAARSDLQRHGGSIQVVETDSTGTTFRLSLPIHTHRISALQFRAAEIDYAMDVSAIESIERVAPSRIYSAGGQVFIKTNSSPLPVVELSALFASDSMSDAKRNAWRFVLVLQLGGSRCGIIVDSVAAVMDVLIESLPKRAGNLSHLQGSFVTADGRTGYVLNPADVLSRVSEHRGLTEPAEESRSKPKRRLLIADDTLTTRALIQTILETAGFEVLAVSDGLQAWRMLEKESFDLLVSDVEMPHMSGLDLTRKIRDSERLKNLPVILLTGRGARKERLMGMEAGADAYLVKSGFDQSELLQRIEDLT